MMITIDHRSAETFTNITTSFVSFKIDRNHFAAPLHIRSFRVPALMSETGKHILGDMSDDSKQAALKYLKLLMNAREKQLIFYRECSFGEKISLTDAISVLGETSVNKNELSSFLKTMSAKKCNGGSNVFGQKACRL